MVVYEVNQEMDQGDFAAFTKWFIEIHVPEMLAIKGFIEATVLVEHNDSENKKRTTCYYFMDSRESLDHYVKNHAAEMTQRLINEFGGRVKLKRRTSDVLATLKPSK